jgi:hypothetical protein
MKKLITLLLLFTITLFYSIPTQAFDIPLNFGVSDNDQAFVQTKNLFDKDTATNGTFVNLTNGTLGTFANTFTSDFIPVNPSTQHIFSHWRSDGGTGVAFYDSNQTFISGISLATITSARIFTTPATAFFIRISMYYNNLVITNVIDVFQVEVGSTSTSYANYGFLSLNDIFLDNQLVSNPNFDNGTTGWTLVGSTGTVSNGVFTFLSNFLNGNLQSPITTIIGNNYYYVSRFKSTSNLVRLRFSTSYHSGSGNYEIISSLHTPSSTSIAVGVLDERSTGFTNNEVDFFYAIDLTNLGINNLTQNQLNGLFNDWYFNNIYNESYNDGFDDGFNDGYIDGFDDGYDDGFDDGVASDTSYAVGYALGLSEGEDKET